jgi:hypothetical protein
MHACHSTALRLGLNTVAAAAQQASTTDKSAAAPVEADEHWDGGQCGQAARQWVDAS